MRTSPVTSRARGNRDLNPRKTALRSSIARTQDRQSHDRGLSVLMIQTATRLPVAISSHPPTTHFSTWLVQLSARPSGHHIVRSRKGKNQSISLSAPNAEAVLLCFGGAATELAPPGQAFHCAIPSRHVRLQNSSGRHCSHRHAASPSLPQPERRGCTDRARFDWRHDRPA